MGGQATAGPGQMELREILDIVEATLEITDDDFNAVPHTSRPGPRQRSRTCCPQLFSRSPSSNALRIPHHNILDARIIDDHVAISYAAQMDERRVCTRCVTYKIGKAIQPADVSAWIASLLARAYPHVPRIRRLKILINPNGGKGGAESTWIREVAPLLRAARCEVDVELTRHRGHAAEIAQGLEIDSFDAVVCCSGDGTPHEVFNGLAKRADARQALARIAVAMIPCGSGNALCVNIAATNSPSLAALAIVKGVKAPLDLVAITQGAQTYYSFLSQAVGIVAELDLGTDHMRWLGEARFTVGFLQRLMGKRVYPAIVSVKVESDNKATIAKDYRARSAESVHSPPAQQKAEETSIPPLRYGTINDPVPPDWETADMPTLGNFYCGNIRWMSAELPFFAAAQLTDGRMDLINLDGSISRLRSIALMQCAENDTFFHQPEVTYRKVLAYRITPRLRPDQKEGLISIDGEKVPFEPFQAEVVPGLGTVVVLPGKEYRANNLAAKERS